MGGSKAFVGVLFQCREYDVAAVTNAVRDALWYEEVLVGLVRFQLWAYRTLGGHPKPASDGHLKTGQS